MSQTGNNKTKENFVHEQQHKNELNKRELWKGETQKKHSRKKTKLGLQIKKGIEIRIT